MSAFCLSFKGVDVDGSNGVWRVWLVEAVKAVCALPARGQVTEEGGCAVLFNAIPLHPLGLVVEVHRQAVILRHAIC